MDNKRNVYNPRNRGRNNGPQFSRQMPPFDRGGTFSDPSRTSHTPSPYYQGAPDMSRKYAYIREKLTA